MVEEPRSSCHRIIKGLIGFILDHDSISGFRSRCEAPSESLLRSAFFQSSQIGLLPIDSPFNDVNIQLDRL